MSWKNDLVGSIINTLKTVDLRATLPFNLERLTPYYYDLLIRKVFQAIKKAAALGYTPEEVSNALPGPANIRTELNVLLDYLHLIKLDKGDKSFLIRYFYKMLRLFNSKDPFCRRGKNLWLSPQEVKKLLKTAPWQKVASDIPLPDLRKLNVGVGSLLYALFTDVFPSAASEFHGPYDASEMFGKGSAMLIDDFFDLKPIALWPQVKTFKHQSLKVLSIYKGGKFFIDYYGNLTQKSDSRSRTHFALFLDNSPWGDLEKIGKLAFYFGNRAVREYEKFKKLEPEEVKKKFIEIHSYQYKGLFDLVKMDWRPSEEMYKRVKDRKLLKEKVEFDLDDYRKELFHILEPI